MNPKVSVVVVSFNTKEKLERCLSCIESQHEVVVVDNASSDGSADMVAAEFPRVKLIRSPQNIGFGPGNNLGCKSTTGDLVLFLNSDAYADPGAISSLASVFDDPEVIAAGGQLLNRDRTLQQSVANRLTLWAVFCEQSYVEKIFRSSKLFSPYWTTRRLALSDEPSKTPQVMGASLMVRAEEGLPVELFDERYFMYCEDTDLCLRLEKHGTILYVPSAKFVHDLGSSSAKDPAMGVIRYNRGKELYFRIHHGGFASFVCLLLDRLGALLRLLVWSVLAIGKPRAKQQAKAFWRVFTDRNRYP